MRVLWITNGPFGLLCELAGQSMPAGGSWLDAAFEALENEKNLELTVITVLPIKEIIKKKLGNHSFYILPGGFASQYDHSLSENKKIWEKIREECRPDLVQIWGTEYAHGYLALQVMKGIPSVIYMQGVMSQIARHYLANMSEKELAESISLRDILKFDWIRRRQQKFYRRSSIENEMIRIAGNVIVENEWCESHCKAIAPDCIAYKSKLTIKKDFYKQEWKAEMIRPYTIMCNATGGYPIKGFHMLLKAMELVIRKYSDSKLLIPGEKSPLDKSFFEKLRINGYTKYIISTIKKLHLENNIVFLGELTSEQMAEQMASSNVFVMPSSIENHSSTLIEAMIVGTPCISSYVGGIPEYLQHNVNGLLYRFEEYEILASHIIKIFDNPAFASGIALNGRAFMRDSRNASNLKKELLWIYEKVCNK